MLAQITIRTCGVNEVICSVQSFFDIDISVKFKIHIQKYMLFFACAQLDLSYHLI